MPPAAPPLICEFLSDTELNADAEWWAIYEQVFPLEERETPMAVLDMLRGDLGIVIRARCGQTTCGIATAHLLRHPPVVFLLYLASAPASRARGVGSALLEYAWNQGAERLSKHGLSALGLLWEVENPALGVDDDERRRRQQRLAFYQQRGGQILPCRYAQPPLHGTTAVPLDLMFRPAPGQPMPDRAALAALVQAVYFEKYAAVNRIPAAVLNALLQNTST